jgi:repressor LexA
MEQLTKKQAAVRKFIETEIKAGRPCPSYREIAAYFGFSSKNAAICHVKALIDKGILIADEGKTRSLQLAAPFPGVPRPVTAEIPLYGSIPAGLGDEREQEPDGCVAVDVASIGFKPTARTFCLKVVGDSMIGKHICEGDIVILEHGPEPRHGDIVAALIDRKSTLKTFVQKGGKRYLKAENPKYSDLVPSDELVIQGVYKGLIRKAKG